MAADELNKKLASICLEICRGIYADSKASGIRVSAEFIFRNGKGDLTVNTFITPDGTTERLLNKDVPMPRGSKLQQDASNQLRKVIRATCKRQRG